MEARRFRPVEHRVVAFGNKYRESAGAVVDRFGRSRSWFASASRDLGEIFQVQLWEVDGSDKLRLRATEVDSENGATIVAAANSLRGMVTGMQIYDEVPDPGDPEDQLRVKSWTFAGPGLIP